MEKGINVTDKEFLDTVRKGLIFIIIILIFSVYMTLEANSELCAERIFYNDSCTHNPFNDLCTCGDMVFLANNTISQIIKIDNHDFCDKYQNLNLSNLLVK